MAAPKKKKPDTAKKKPANPLQAGRAVLTKALKGQDASLSFVAADENRMKRSLPHLPTGSIVIDNLIGGRLNRFGVMPCPGLPRGRVVNLYGMESAGKTTLCLMASATTTRAGGTVCFIDWEHAIDLSYAMAIGVPVQDETKFMLAQPETLEQGIKILWMMARAGVDLIVVDSVSAGVPETVINQSLEEKGNAGRVGEVARIWSGFLPQLKGVISKTQSCIIGVSQLRKMISKSGYGPDTTTAGGESWKFYSELRIMLRRVKTEKGSVYDSRKHQKVESATGTIIKAKIDKCKVAASQGLEDEFYIKFGDGIDDVRSVVDTAVGHGVVKKGGAWYAYERPDGSVIKGQGMDAFKAELQGVKGAWAELYQSTLGAMTTSTVATVAAPEDDDLSDLDAILTGKAPIPDQPEDGGGHTV